MRTSSRPTVTKRVALLTGALLLLPGSAALAQEADDVDVDDVCYADPTNPVCEGPEVIDEVVDSEETVVDSESEEALDAETVAVTTTVSAGADTELANTGADIAVLSLLAAFLLGGGLLTVFTSRRRTSGSTAR